MNSLETSHDDEVDRLWMRLGRWQEYRGEASANLVRVLGIAVFYAIELATTKGVNLGPLQLAASGDKATHDAVTALTVAWATLALGVYLALQRRYFPRALSFVSTGLDLLLLTLLLLIVNGPRSPLVVVYLLIVSLATLRFRLPLVWFTTAGAIVGYLVVLGHARYFAASPERLVPRYAQVIFLAALALCGVLQGQVIRQVRGLARDFAARLIELSPEWEKVSS